MIKYFVVFHAECDGELPKNDVVEFHKEISSMEDIEEIQKEIAESWFGDDREIVLINYKKL